MRLHGRQATLVSGWYARAFARLVSALASTSDGKEQAQLRQRHEKKLMGMKQPKKRAGERAAENKPSKQAHRIYRQRRGLGSLKHRVEKAAGEKKDIRWWKN